MRKGIVKKVVCAGIAAALSLQGMPAFAASGSWGSDATGWYYSYSEGGYAYNKWEQIDGYWYYFDNSGYMDYSGYRDGCWLGADGSWNTAYSGGYWASNDTGWWYTDASGWYPVSTWLKIDGSYYYFKDSGYMASNEWIDGCYLGADGAGQANKVEARADLADGNTGGLTYVYSSEKGAGWQTAYINKLADAKENGGGSYGTDQEADSYFIYDVDSDGTPELFIKYGDCEAAYNTVAYCYENGVAKEISGVGGGHVSYYSVPGGGMISWWAHMGYSNISMMTYSNGAFESTGIYSEGEIDYSAEYKKPTDFYAGAEYLTGVNLNNILPIVSYGLDKITTGSAADNETARAAIQNVIDNNGDVYLSYTYSFDDRENIGLISFNDMMKKGKLNKYSNLSLNYTTWGDLNGDGQEECLAVFKSTKKKYSGCSAVLSYQNGHVYAYYVFDDEKGMEIKDGKIHIPNSTGETVEGLEFYKDLAYVTYPN